MFPTMVSRDTNIDLKDVNAFLVLGKEDLSRGFTN